MFGTLVESSVPFNESVGDEVADGPHGPAVNFVFFLN